MPNNDLISRSALVDEFRARKMTDAVPDYDRATVDVKDALYQYAQLTKGLLFAAPAVDAEVVRHGRWIMRGGYIRCSECDAKTLWKDTGGTGGFSHEYEQVRSVHCHNCGAKMDGDVNA